jgi:hypothetical protein
MSVVDIGNDGKTSTAVLRVNIRVWTSAKQWYCTLIVLQAGRCTLVLHESSE